MENPESEKAPITNEMVTDAMVKAVCDANAVMREILGIQLPLLLVAWDAEKMAYATTAPKYAIPTVICRMYEDSLKVSE